MPTVADSIISFFLSVKEPYPLPSGVETMNPYVNQEVRDCISVFYTRYYNDTTARVGVFGINPGRHGAGITGISFTDPVSLAEECGIPNSLGTHRELSSIFIYDAIRAFGGLQAFTSSFYLSALSPLGFIKDGINYNFYDDKLFAKQMEEYMHGCMLRQLQHPLRTDVAICLGTGKLFAAFSALNKRHSYFGHIIPLEHPRYILQYKRKSVAAYLQKYVEVFSSCVF
ncbi:MAG: DUF4918 family protein [Candidatus Kapabacteria bacterium]|nr:DUF4918 family protein [Candidatus Kapabacteria bacterium]